MVLLFVSLGCNFFFVSGGFYGLVAVIGSAVGCSVDCVLTRDRTFFLFTKKIESAGSRAAAVNEVRNKLIRRTDRAKKPAERIGCLIMRSGDMFFIAGRPVRVCRRASFKSAEARWVGGSEMFDFGLSQTHGHTDGGWTGGTDCGPGMRRNAVVCWLLDLTCCHNDGQLNVCSGRESITRRHEA